MVCPCGKCGRGSTDNGPRSEITQTKSCADHDHVGRKRYRKIHRKKKSGHDGGKIADRVISFHHFPADILEKDAGRNGKKRDENSTDPEIIPSGKCRREECDDHIAHDRLGSRFIPDVRGVRDLQFH